MKKLFVLSLALCMLIMPVFAQASTALPLGLTFDMDWKQAAETLGSDAELLPWSDTGYESEMGSILLSDVTISNPEMKVDQVYVSVQRNNSARVSRVSDISLYLPVDVNCIAGFRNALAAMTAAYGEPANDPFDAPSVQEYVEYGTLQANWVFDDCHIELDLRRSYEDYITVSYISRINFDASDLD